MVREAGDSQNSLKDFREVAEQAYMRVAEACGRAFEEMRRGDEEFCRTHGITHVHLISPLHNPPYY